MSETVMCAGLRLGSGARLGPVIPSWRPALPLQRLSRLGLGVCGDLSRAQSLSLHITSVPVDKNNRGRCHSILTSIDIVGEPSSQ
jgi:hypothetical protein